MPRCVDGREPHKLDLSDTGRLPLEIHARGKWLAWSKRDPGLAVKRGDLYRVSRPGGDPKPFRVFVVVSRQALIDSKFSTVVCAPVYSARYGLSTELPVGVDEGLRHDSSVHCDALVSLPKASLTRFVGTLAAARMPELDRALAIALGMTSGLT